MARGKSSGTDEHLEALRGMWNEMKAVKAALETQLGGLRSELIERIDQTNAKLDAVRDELKGEADSLRRRMVESETRLATATLQLTTDVRDLGGLIREWRVEHREDRLDLRARLERLEKHAGFAAH